MADTPDELDRFIMVIAPDGSPEAMIDAVLANTNGRKLAFALATHCHDTDTVQDLIAKSARAVSAEEFRYLCIVALQALSREILGPVVGIAKNHGADLLPGLRYVASELGALDGEVS